MKAPAVNSFPAAATAARPLRHEVRIIGGSLKRTRLAVADKPGLRPTPNRVRETLFNWLGQDLTGWRCLDAFAGTGALGLEAASRGAASVLLVERDPQLAASLQRCVRQLKLQDVVQVRRGDGLQELRQATPGALDLIFLDPPFDAGDFEVALASAAAVIAPCGWIYLESPAVWTDASLRTKGLSVQRHLRAGAVHAHLLQVLN